MEASRDSQKLKSQLTLSRAVYDICYHLKPLPLGEAMSGAEADNNGQLIAHYSRKGLDEHQHSLILWVGKVSLNSSFAVRATRP